jgi:hypothetical protein
VRTVGTQISIPNWDRKKRDPALEYTARSAVEALKAVRTAGIDLTLVGDDLALSAASASA